MPVGEHSPVRLLPVVVRKVPRKAKKRANSSTGYCKEETCWRRGRDSTIANIADVSQISYLADKSMYSNSLEFFSVIEPSFPSFSNSLLFRHERYH